MALSQIVKQKCPSCGKTAVEKSRVSFGSAVMITLECGHVVSESAIESSSAVIASEDGKTLMPYQLEAVRFAEAANGRVLFAHQQGLGKTVMATALLQLHKEQLTPVVLVVPTTVKAQWYYEIVRWTGHPMKGGLFCQMINSGKEFPLPGMQVYIVTYDLLKSIDFSSVKVSTVILDECQRIKNHLSERAKAVQKLVRTNQVEHILALSGTPIKNNAGEYFTILNLLQPRRFPEFQKYIDKYCDSYNNGYGGKIGGLRDPERFYEDTKDFIIRRTKDEVLPDLPSLSRKFYHVELDRKLNKAYAEQLKELDDLLYNDEMDNSEMNTCILAIYSKMRKITGISKVFECVDFVAEHLESTDRPITIFLHHHDAHTLLEQKLNQYCDENGIARPLNLRAELNGDDRAALVKRFQEGKSRILIASTLAAGEGLNLQFCSDAVMLERQWNPANEEQAEGRFHRFGQKNAVSITYMLASETIDEYFTELVEQKRAISASTLDRKEVVWDQNSLVKELAQILVTKGRDRWRM